MFDWVLSMSLSLYAEIGICIVALSTIQEQSKLVLNILMRQLIYCDWIFLLKTKGSSSTIE